MNKVTRFEHLHGHWPTAKEAEEDSEPGVSLLLRSDLFVFRYLVFCFKIILGIKYHTFYDFEVYWYLGGKIAGILVSHYPPWPGLIYDKQRVAAARLQSEASSPFLPSRVLEISSS